MNKSFLTKFVNNRHEQTFCRVNLNYQSMESKEVMLEKIIDSILQLVEMIRCTSYFYDILMYIKNFVILLKNFIKITF